jgi:hypothetical protein
MEPTDQLDAPNRRLPESRVERFAKRNSASRTSSICLSDILNFPRKSFRFFSFSDQAKWLALALEALFRRVTGTIVGRIFVIAIRRSGESITPRVECLGQTSRASSSLLPDRRCRLHPEHFDESRKRGGLLLLTRIVEEKTRERRTPILPHAH